MKKINAKFLTSKFLNSLKMGETKTLVSGKLQVKRILGGFAYEYLSKTGDVTAAMFVSTNELLNL